MACSFLQCSYGGSTRTNGSQWPDPFPNWWFRWHPKSTLVSSPWERWVHQSAVEPGNPEIGYANLQQGYFESTRFELTGRIGFHCSPNQQAGEARAISNWTPPICRSTFPTRFTLLRKPSMEINWTEEDSWDCYFGRFWRSKRKRLEQPHHGQNSKPGIYAWGRISMSNFSSITSLGESPVKWSNSLMQGLMMVWFKSTHRTLEKLD